ncbi:hypothetical protein SELMODRAFT_141846 [Selaginella moellendorffii]|uniref:Uncharacterized protein COP1L1-1 n=2 Tax=Selaginella moellendorffii TaxID=88036 RepID=D8QWL1_SELML|nr:hypothetical protein SELMODRAFT_141846 [Selaginella moellendorffii]
MCIMTHLNIKSNCPCCGAYLTSGQLYPNFLLNKILRKASVCQVASSASPGEHLRLALKQGADISMKDIDTLLSLLTEKKRKAEREEAETNLEVLHDFLQRSRQQKQQELNEIQTDLQWLKEDIAAVEKQATSLKKSKERHASPVHQKLPSSRCRAKASEAEGRSPDGEKARLKRAQTDDEGTSGVRESEVLSKKRRVLSQFEDLQDCYLQKRKQSQDPSETGESLSSHATGLEDFQAVLNSFTRYSQLRVVAEVRHPDLFQNSNIVSSIEFDRDDEFFATAGVSRRIKVFEYSAVVNSSADVHYPAMEIPSRAKLSCLSWNKCIKHHIASSDYDGSVTIWDVNNAQSIMEYEEHAKRAWSVDFARTDPNLLVSGSDDGKLKVWSTRQESSVMGIDMKANICCVKFNPSSSNFVAVGSADHRIHYYDLRSPASPVHTFSGHQKTVSYVKFITPEELVSASTDSTLRIWNVRTNTPIRTLTGHINERNFVGLSGNSDYVTCGSETNEVFVYHKAISRPATRHRFGSLDDSLHFISAVCWKSDSPTLLAANSQGTIKVLVMAA